MSKHEYAAGQVWAYRTRPGDEASRVKIHAVEPYPGPGGEDEVFHVSVVGFSFRNPDAPPVLSHVPVARETLDASLTEQVPGEGDFPDPAEGIASWRENGGGVFNLPIADIVQMFDDLSMGFAPSGPDHEGNLYFRVDAEHDRPADPAWVMYEVDPEGRVLRTIHCFPDGAGFLTSVDDVDPGQLPSPGSLAAASFYEIWQDVELGVPISDEGGTVLLTQAPPEEFEALWQDNRE